MREAALHLVPDVATPAAIDARINGRYAIVPTRPTHLSPLAANMRAEDRSEIEGLGVGVKKALWRGYRNSIMVKTAIVDGQPAAIWGLCLALRPGLSLLSDVGVPWLHTTAAIERIPIAFLKEARREVAAMLALCPHLENHVTADYARAVRFLRLLGFTIDAPAPVGADGRQYCRFHLTRV